MSNKLTLLLLTLFFGLVLSIGFVSAVLSDGLIQYYPLEEESGNITYDMVYGSVGIHPNGIIQNVMGKINKSYQYGGTYTQIDYNIELTNQATWSFWLYPSANTLAGLLSKRDGAGTSNWQLYLDENGYLQIFFWMPDLTIITVSVVVPSDSWTYVTASWNGTDVQVYYDGVNVQSSSIIGTLTNNNISTRIGHDWYYNDYFGKVDELAIWNRSLSESEIEFLYNSGNGTDFYQVNYSLPSPSENASSLVVELLNPEESEIITALPYNFVAQATPTNLNLTNATFIISFLNSSVAYSQDQNLSSDVAINISQSVSNLSDGDYTFNVVVCGTNSTGFICEQDIDSHAFSLNTTVITPPIIITENNDIVDTLTYTGVGAGVLIESITPSIIKFFIVIVILTAFSLLIYFFIHEFLLKRLGGG